METKDSMKMNYEYIGPYNMKKALFSIESWANTSHSIIFRKMNAARYEFATVNFQRNKSRMHEGKREWEGMKEKSWTNN